MPYGVLIIEDERTLASNIKRFLERNDCDVSIAGNAAEGLALLETFKPDCVLLDHRLPDSDGLTVLEAIRRFDPHIAVIVMTAHGGVQLAVEAMKAGARDYLSKPLVLSELKLVLDKAVGIDRLNGALSYYRRRDAEDSGLAKIIGTSPAIMAVKRLIRQLIEAEGRLTAGAAPPVLITGETGTGKELVARALHFDGARRGAALIELNCAALPGHLIESELFGYERGAFTDAHQRKIGLAEAADGGTLFLDEIGDLDGAVQVKLLRLLENKTLRRLGSVRERSVDIRLISATHRPLEELVQDGRFRSDLYYRLRVVTVPLPPLRERGDDVLLLADHFLALHARRYGKPGLSLDAGAAARLVAHSWPGNVRELGNVLEQAVLLASGSRIGAEHILLAPAAASPAAPAAEPIAGLTESERELISKALQQSAGNISQAARLLGISRDTLRYRMEKHSLR